LSLLLPGGRVIFNASAGQSLAETAAEKSGVTRILVTGAAGFIGQILCRALTARGHRVIAGLRRPRDPGAAPITAAETRLLGDIVPERRWAGDLDDIDAVVHLAQRAHRRTATAALAGEPSASASLLHAAATAGARRFVYLSSIKAMGETTLPGRPYRPAGGCLWPWEAGDRAGTGRGGTE
jgi:nucleoside-diphosphate-sugar epimerase